MDQEPSTTTTDDLVPFTRVGTFIRQVTHDVRNGLNAIDLEAAFVTELNSDPEIAEEMKKLRSMITNTTKMLQNISSHFGMLSPNLVVFPSKLFLEGFRERLSKLYSEKINTIDWVENLGEESIEVDFELMTTALTEVFKNAFEFQEKDQEIKFQSHVKQNQIILEVSEGKPSLSSSPENWGLEPLLSTRRGGYGLGLMYARKIISANNGEIKIDHDKKSKILRTRIFLPLANA